MYPLGVLFGLGFDTSSEVALLGIASIQAAKGTSIWLILIFPVLFTGKQTFLFYRRSKNAPFPTVLRGPDCLIKVCLVSATVGMCLLDTIDGALMMALYTSTAFAKDQIAILYYSIVLTVITVIVAIVIGLIQLLTLLLNILQPTGKFWDGVEVAGAHYDVIGKRVISSSPFLFVLSHLPFSSTHTKKTNPTPNAPGGAICASFVVLGAASVVCYKPWRRWVEKGRSVRRGDAEVGAHNECRSDEVQVGSAGKEGVSKEKGGSEESTTTVSETRVVGGDVEVCRNC